MLGSLRQLWYPKEFRIPPPVLPGNLAVLLREELGHLIGQGASIQPGADGSPAPPGEGPDLHLLAEISTGVWRVRRKSVGPGTAPTSPEARQAQRHLEAVWDTLAQEGIEIQDHTDTRFDDGMSLKVVGFQPTPGIGRPVVIETIRPTVYYKKQRIQMGEVIVGSPMPQENGADTHG